MQTIIIATKNAGKAREYAEMFGPLGFEIKTLADFLPISINENGQSFEENALVKVQAVVDKFGIAAIADDSGLCVDALNGAPGIHSARYAGDHDDAANRAKLLAALADVPDDQRTAHFHTTIVGLKPDGAKLVANGRVDGHILHHEIGHNGFGYDSIFFADQLQQSMACLTADEKNAISHRGNALRQFMQHFNDWWQA